MNKTHTRNLQFQGICWHFVFVSSLSSSSTPQVWKTGQGFDPAHEEDAKPKGPWPSQRLGAVLRNLLWPQHYTTTLGRFFCQFWWCGFPKFIPLFCRPWLLPMVWFGGNLEDDVTSAVQCSGRLTANVLSCCKNNIDVKCQSSNDNIQFQVKSQWAEPQTKQ